MSEFLNFQDVPVVALDELVQSGDIELGRGNIISKIDIRAVSGLYPIYSSSSKNNGMMGRYGKFMFDEEMVTWSVDGGGTFFYRPRHKFSVTNVSGYMRANQEKFDYKFLHGVLDYQHSFLNFDYQSKAHPSVIRELYEIPILPLPEQKKIASILTSVDEVIESTQKQIDKLQDLKKATMNELLTKGIGHTEFKDSELGRIPKSWEVINLGSISQVVDSMHQTPTFSDHGKAMVRVTEIRNGEFIDISSAVNVNEETYKAFTKNYKPRFGDILIARVGAYFGVSTYVDKEVTFCLGQNTAAIRPKDIESDFLFFFINSECVRNQMNDVVSVGAQPSLSLEVIKKIKVVCPPDSEQKLIAKSIFSITSKIINTNLKLSQTQSLKKSLMQDLLTGKVRVTVN